jgi:hypothetical protein
MDKITVLSIVATLIVSSCNSAPKANIKVYETVGILESTRPTGCIPVSELSNKQNPVNIFTGLKECLSQNNYAYTAELYFAGMTYGF